MGKLPIVALIGQTNAGKSSILNRMARKNIAIVAREEGTTRDNVMATIDGSFILIDTAGLKDPSDDFEASIQDQIADAIEVADVILVVLDSTKYLDFRDKNIAKNALKSKKPVFLLLNKADLSESLPDEEFLRLGIKNSETFRVSATTGAGFKILKEALSGVLRAFRSAAARDLAREPRGDGSERRGPKNTSRDSEFLKIAPKNTSKAPSALKIALIGRPNVGKSSLFNVLGKKQQAIVSSRQGTTRDVNRVQVRYKGREIEILDTAGLRKPGKREVGIEKFSAIRTLAAIEEADICALLVDSTEPHSKLDQSLAGQIIEAGKGIIMVVTKIDIIKGKLEAAACPSDNSSQAALAKSSRSAEHIAASSSPFDSLLDDLERDYNFLPYAPVVLTSSETGKNVTQIFDLALTIDAARHTEVKTSELNKILATAIVEHAPAGLKNTRPKPKYIVQTDICPPWFVVHGHDLSLLHWSWKRYLERKIREKYPFIGTPIMFSYRSDNAKGGERDSDED